MITNTSPTSRTSKNWAEAYGREGITWEQALAIAGYTGNNIERLRPKNMTPALEAAMGYCVFRGWQAFPSDTTEKKSYLSAKYAPGAEAWGMTNDPSSCGATSSMRMAAPVRRRRSDRMGQPHLRHRGRHQGGTWRRWSGVVIEAGGEVRQAARYADGGEPHGFATSHLQASRSRHQGHQPRLPGYPGVDIKGDGGMFVAPPSVRGDGGYRWLNDLPIADAPQWLIDLVTRRGNGTGAREQR